MGLFSVFNKCIGDDMKAAAHQSLNCIKNKKLKYGEKRFSIWQMEYLLHPAIWHDHDIDFVRWLHPVMWLWNCDTEFTKWQHPALWQVALGWHAMEFAQRPLYWNSTSGFHNHTLPQSNVILYQSAKFYRNRTTLGRKKVTSCRFSRWRISAILDCRDLMMGSLKSPVKLT